jgi:hypothetical protein
MSTPSTPRPRPEDNRLTADAVCWYCGYRAAMPEWECCRVCWEVYYATDPDQLPFPPEGDRRWWGR